MQKKTQFSLRLSPEKSRTLKVLAAYQLRSLQKILEELIDKYIEDNKSLLKSSKSCVSLKKKS